MRFLLILTVLACGVANADILTFTGRTAFLAAIGDEYYEEPFDSLASGSSGTYSLRFSQNDFALTIFTNLAGTLYGETIEGDKAISVGSRGDSLRVSGFSPGINAIGGTFYFDAFPGLSSTASGSITVSNGVDSDVAVDVGPTSSLTNFAGFLSTTPLESLRFRQTSNVRAFPAIGEVIVSGQADTGVPEPGTIGLALAGLAAIAALRKRR